MPVALPILDTPQDELYPAYEPGTASTTQGIVEQVMQQDFPQLAALGLEAYAPRLLRCDYTDGTAVFYLDWTPERPGYTLCYLEPWTSTVDETGAMCVNIRYYRGLEAAKRAEDIRRCIPPDLT